MKKRKLILAAIIILAVVLFVSCEFSFGSLYDVKIVNNTSSLYCDDINIVDSAQETWGDDCMPSDTSLDPGETITLTGVGPISTPDDISVRAQDRLYGIDKWGDHLDITKTIYITASGITN